MRCKAGDLAIVIKDEDFPQNVGLIVKVIGAPNADEYPNHTIEHQDWECESSAPIWGWDDAEKTMASVGAGIIAIPDDELQPLRGLPAGVTQSMVAPPTRRVLA
jgi:hypothetical protein